MAGEAECFLVLIMRRRIVTVNNARVVPAKNKQKRNQQITI
jgi:hypothetical protein